jgi:hypothetical protein
MDTSGKASGRHAQWPNQPGYSTSQGEHQRRLQGASVPRENDGHDPWPPQQTQLFDDEGHNDSSTSAAPGPQNTVHNLPQQQQQGGVHSRRSHEGESSQRENLPTHPLSSVEWRTPYGRSELHCGRAATPQRSPPRMRESMSLCTSGLGTASVQASWDSHRGKASGAVGSQTSTATRANHSNCENKIDLNDHDNASEQQLCSPRQRILERWPNDRDNDPCSSRNAVRWSRADALGVAHDKVPVYRTSQQAQLGATSRSSSNGMLHATGQDSFEQQHEERILCDVRPAGTRRKGRMVIRRDVKIEVNCSPGATVPLNSSEGYRTDAVCLAKEDRALDTDDIASDSDEDLTREREMLKLGKRKARAMPSTFDDRSEPHRERHVIVESAKVQRRGQGSDIPLKEAAKRCSQPSTIVDGEPHTRYGSTSQMHGRDRRTKYPIGRRESAKSVPKALRKVRTKSRQCQYPTGCDKCAQGSTLYCKAHGGGKRCEYPEGCDKSAQGSTMFCKAHGGGKRCQYPEGCDKSAMAGPKQLCKAHGGGKCVNIQRVATRVLGNQRRFA